MYKTEAFERMDQELANIRELRPVIEQLPDELPGVVSYGQGHIFVDVGNGFRDKEDMRFDNLAVSYGTGFQISSPAGPIRIDRAWVQEHDSFEYAHRWHFTILYAF